MAELKQIIPEGYKQTELGVIPEDWSISTLGDVLTDFRNGYAFSAKGYCSSGTPILTMAQIGLSGSFQFDEEKVNRWDDHHFNKLKDFWVLDGDLLIAMTDVTPDKNLIGQMTVAKLQSVALLNQRVGLLRVNSQKGIPSFFSYLSCLPVWKSYCKGVASLGVQANIGTNDIRKALVPLPTVKEQTAIANALSDVDALISELEKLIAKKQAIKTATMQQLLTGKIRLPEFSLREDGTPKGYKQSELGEIPEDWEVVSLGDIFTLKNGFSFKGEYFSSTGPIVLTPGNFKLDGGLYFEPRNTKHYSAKYPNEYEFSKNDLVIVMTDLTPDCNLLGKPAFIIHDEKILHNQRIGKIESLSDNWNAQFLYYVLLSSFYLKHIKNAATGSTVRHTSPKTIAIAKVFSPSESEQISIAACLLAMDKELELIRVHLEKVSQIKQGMMQELLTGKTRLVKAEVTA